MLDTCTTGSGGGKSTVVHLFLRFYDPIGGRLTFGGVDLRELNLVDLHRHTGFVGQDTQLFNATLLQNVVYGVGREVADAEIEGAARAAQAHGFITGFEDGYSTRIGDKGQRLSGGQRQRIAIARCLLRQPRLVLLDEATSALDTESEAAVQRALDGLIWSEQRTVLLVAHRLSTVVGATKIVVLEGGMVAEQGSHHELLARGVEEGAYARLVAHQVGK